MVGQEPRLWGQVAVKNAEGFEFDARVNSAFWEEHAKYGTYLILMLERLDSGVEMKQKYRYSLNENSKFMLLQKGLLHCGVVTADPKELEGIEFHWKRQDMKAGKDAVTQEDITSFVMVPTKCLTPGVAKGTPGPSQAPKSPAAAAKAAAVAERATVAPPPASAPPPLATPPLAEEPKEAPQPQPVQSPPVVEKPAIQPTGGSAGGQKGKVLEMLKEAPQTITEIVDELKVSEGDAKALVAELVSEGKAREKKGVVQLALS